MSDRRRPAGAMLMACHDCGLVQTVGDLPEGAAAVCTRCSGVLFRHRSDSIDRALALNCAGLLLFGIAITFPLMTLTMSGQGTSTSLVKGVTALWASGMWGLATLVGLVAIAVPFGKLVGSIYALTLVRTGRTDRCWGLVPIFRLLERLHPWAMTEVYLLGLIVAWVKLRDLATIDLGPALFALIGLIVTLVWAESALEPHEVWERIAPQRRAPAGPGDAALDYLSCHDCAQLVPAGAEAGGHAAHCPRCGTTLHARKPQSLARTWALVIAAAILYVPANLLPVMTVVSLGHGEADTILSGVKTLIAAGMWPVALLVFVASITVPVLKIVGLVYLLITAQRRSAQRRRDRTRLFRVIEAVGRWSMVDIFMISILVALVNLGELAQIEPGAGAAAFAAVVVLTMIASHSFDPRLMWDSPRGSSNAERA